MAKRRQQSQGVDPFGTDGSVGAAAARTDGGFFGGDEGEGDMFGLSSQPDEPESPEPADSQLADDAVETGPGLFDAPTPAPVDESPPVAPTVSPAGFELAPAAAASSRRPAGSAAPAPDAEPYVVLARRYRPQTFAEIVGQESVRSALCNAIAHGQVGHAYLFSGPRGTGKTSTARILAKALNCLDGGPRPDPCGRCASCRSITTGTSLDVIEIDAASNTGVDNIRDLRTGVSLSPFSRFKVYIVDEVHMLSTQAFNALLKTLEEPPPQVIFVLATTELNKVPETIVSRCQPFAFRRFTVPEIAGQLDHILDLELASRGVAIDSAERGRILELIAQNAEGGMRDAQVALDQVLVLASGSLDFDTVRRFLGAVETRFLDEFIVAMREQRAADLLALIDDLVGSGQDIERFVRNAASFVRDLMVVKAAPDKPGLLSVSPNRLARMRDLTERLPMAFLLNAASTLFGLLEKMKTAAQPRFLLEIAAVRMAAVDVVDDISGILNRLDRLEGTLAGRAEIPPVTPVPPPAPAPQPAPPAGPVPEPERHSASIQAPTQRQGADYNAIAGTPVGQSASGVSATADRVAESSDPPVPPVVFSGSLDAEAFMAQLRERTATRHNFLHVNLLDATILSFDGHRAVIGVNPADRFTHERLNRQANLAILKGVAQEITGGDVSFRLQFVVPICESTPAPQADFTSAEGPEPVVEAPPRSQSTSATAFLPQPSSSENERTLEEELAEADRVMRRKKLSEKPLTGDMLKQFVESQPPLKALTDIIKSTLDVDDTQLSFKLT